MTDYLGPYLLGPNDTPENGIYTGDARDLAEVIPDESVDLIFADPIYQNVDDYRWLAEIALRLLRPDSALLAWCSNVKQFAVQPIMAQFLRLILPFQYTCIGKTYAMNHYHTFIWTTPCLWFAKGNVKPSRWIPDTYISTAPTAKINGHKWNKNPEAYMTWLSAFTDKGDIVLDPFTGGGTVPAVCKMLGRRYLAFEINAATAERARERVRNTQPPLFVPEPEQGSFDFAAQGAFHA